MGSLVLTLGDTGLTLADLDSILYDENNEVTSFTLVLTEQSPGAYLLSIPDDFRWYSFTYEYPTGVASTRRFGRYLYPYEAPPGIVIGLREPGITIDDLAITVYLDGVLRTDTLALTNLGNNDYYLTGWPTTQSSSTAGRWSLSWTYNGVTYSFEWTVPLYTVSAFAAEFIDLMSDTLIATPGVLDEYGAFVASGVVMSLPCRIEGAARLVRDPSGQEVVSSVQVIVAGYDDLTVEGHRYTLPARFNPRIDLRAIVIDKESDESGPCYEEIDLP
jgi:hypothetical protein